MRLVAHFDLLIRLLFGLAWFGTAVFLKRSKKKSWTYLALFSIFYVYIFKVLDYTLIQYQSLLLLRHFEPGLILNGQAGGGSTNLVPLVTLGSEDVKTSLLNVLLMVPFGFGLPFVTDFRTKQVLVTGALFSVAIELLQLATGLVSGVTFRISDVNDVIFNASGVAIGCVLFFVFSRIYRRAFRNRETPANPILRYIAERPQMDG